MPVKCNQLYSNVTNQVKPNTLTMRAVYFVAINNGNVNTHTMHLVQLSSIAPIYVSMCPPLSQCTHVGC